MNQQLNILSVQDLQDLFGGGANSSYIDGERLVKGIIPVYSPFGLSVLVW